MSELVDKLMAQSSTVHSGAYHSMREAANRIAALENACRAYLEAYDSAAGTVFVEPIIRTVMEESK